MTGSLQGSWTYPGLMVNLTMLVDGSGRVHSYHAEYGTIMQASRSSETMGMGIPAAASSLASLVQVLSYNSVFMDRLRVAGSQVEVVSSAVGDDLAASVKREGIPSQNDVRKDKLPPEVLQGGRILILGLL